WVISSVVAGLAGVLLAPLYGRVNAMDFEMVVVAAIAAAVFGGLSSLTLTVVGGLALGIGQDLIAAYLPLGSSVAQGLRPSLPFILLLAVLVLAGPALVRWKHGGDPMAGVDVVPGRGGRGFGGPGLLAQGLDGPVQVCVAAVGGIGLVAVLAFALPPYWLFLASECAALAVVFCSFTVLSGMGGQISLCQAEFAGIGAFMAGQLAVHENLSVIAGLAAGAGAAGVIGLLVAIPVLRVSGLYLALGTFAFALLVDSVGFAPAWSGNGASGILVPRPLIGPVSFDATRPFFVLAVLVLVVVGLGVVWLRRSTAGKYLVAVRGSELAAASVGIDVRRVKVVAFGIAAAIAGLGGALYGTTLGAVSASNFSFYQSLFWLVVVAITGMRSIGGAIAAGVAVVVLPQLISLEGGGLSSLSAVVFGLGAIVYIRHQEGLVAWLGALCARAVRRRPGDVGPGGPGLGNPGPGGPG
ncbi:MAG: ABC transporter permease subunit, partial [Acidimicrobiales bacterium]